MSEIPLARSHPKELLKREIGPTGLAISIVNLTIGTGIFTLPALAAENLGAAAILCFFVCGIVIFLIALCFAEVGSKVQISGGSYVYIEDAFGPYAGFLANIIYLASCVFADSAGAKVLATILLYFLPFKDGILYQDSIYILLFSGLAYINIRGTRQGLRLIYLTSAAKLIPLILLIVLGARHVQISNLHWSHIPSLHEIGEGTMILFFAFTGIEVAVSNGGEFKNPSRTVPIGIIAGIISVLVIYLLIQIVSQGILGAALPQFKEAPLAEVANRAIGWSGLFLISFGMFFSILGSVSGEVLGSSRMLFAGARDGIYPHLLFKTHKKFFTPYWSVLVYCAADLCMSLIGNFKQLILLASTAILLVYLGVVWAAWKIKLNKKRRAEKGFSMPGGWVIPLLTTLIIFWLLFQLSLMEIYGTLAFLAISSLIYLGIFLYKKGKKPGS